ncbi:hypothetical protein RDMS_06865 [Deinococcus sp. RL]|nr:hypothetical protein RDMS_06865 [Deinococcus sp. RL]
MDRPDFSVLPIRQALAILSERIAPRLPAKLIHAHEKVSDADLVALAVLRFVRKVPYFSHWWRLLQLDVGLTLPSESQAHVRLKRLLPVVEQLLNEVEMLDFVLVDSEPIPSCRFKRAKRCKFPGATFGFTTQGMIYGYKLHAWTTPGGRVVRYLLRPASLGVKSGEEVGKRVCRPTVGLGQHGAKGIQATSEEAFGRVAVPEAA